MQDGCKVYMDPDLASNASCFMVTWIFFNKHLLFCTLLLLGLRASSGLAPNCVVLVLGYEGMGPHHVQGHHTWDLGIGLRKLVVLNIHQILNRCYK